MKNELKTKLAIISAIIAAVILVSLPLGCGNPPVTDITTAMAYDIIAQNEGSADLIIIDVRTAPEYESAHIPGAVNIDVTADSFDSEIENLDKELIYLVYCQSGGRSQTAVNTMEEAGFENIYHMESGFTSWQNAGYDTE